MHLTKTIQIYLQEAGDEKLKKSSASCIPVTYTGTGLPWPIPECNSCSPVFMHGTTMVPYGNSDHKWKKRKWNQQIKEN
jgi:hypothetical protein